MKLVVAFRNFANASNNTPKGSSSRKYIKCGGLGLFTIFFGRDGEISTYVEKRPHRPWGHPAFYLLEIGFISRENRLRIYGAILITPTLLHGLH